MLAKVFDTLHNTLARVISASHNTLARVFSASHNTLARVFSASHNTLARVLEEASYKMHECWKMRHTKLLHEFHILYRMELFPEAKYSAICDESFVH